METGREASMYLGKLYDESIVTIMAAFKDADCTVTEVSASEIERWNNMPTVQALPQDWVKRANEAGLNGEVILEEVLKALNKYR